mmetsp:Transcript_36356/g.102436  ORF Transcript_36356/g.102436 Transcript_36356/m.102436 type:complete len:419 (+) Transcript_36356:597-1853(+)
MDGVRHKGILCVHNFLAEHSHGHGGVVQSGALTAQPGPLVELGCPHTLDGGPRLRPPAVPSDASLRQALRERIPQGRGSFHSKNAVPELLQRVRIRLPRSSQSPQESLVLRGDRGIGWLGESRFHGAERQDRGRRRAYPRGETPAEPGEVAALASRGMGPQCVRLHHQLAAKLRLHQRLGPRAPRAARAGGWLPRRCELALLDPKVGSAQRAHRHSRADARLQAVEDGFRKACGEQGARIASAHGHVREQVGQVEGENPGDALRNLFLATHVVHQEHSGRGIHLPLDICQPLDVRELPGGLLGADDLPVAELGAFAQARERRLDELREGCSGRSPDDLLGEQGGDALVTPEPGPEGFGGRLQQLLGGARPHGHQVQHAVQVGTHPQSHPLLQGLSGARERVAHPRELIPARAQFSVGA